MYDGVAWIGNEKRGKTCNLQKLVGEEAYESTKNIRKGNKLLFESLRLPIFSPIEMRFHIHVTEYYSNKERKLMVHSGTMSAN